MSRPPPSGPSLWASAIQSVAPNPNPATANPVIMPFLSGNQRMPTAIGTTYASPMPAPPIRPMQTNTTGNFVAPRRPAIA